MPLITRAFSVRLTAVLLASLLLPALIGSAQSAGDAPTPDESPAAQAAAPTLHPREGKIDLSGGLAELNVPKEFRFLDKDDSHKILVDVWHNPPGAAEGVLGMLVPAEFGEHGKDSWAVVITYEASGYVKDNDASKLNYDDLLKQMQKATQEHNAEREKEGYPAVELVGWAAPPRYDAATKKMYWAKEIRFGDHPEGPDTLNYDIRILGRRGVLVLNAVAGMDQLDEIREATPQILGMVNYNQGNRYADFDPKTDKVAAYGLAALVVGGIAAKAGLFKLMIPVLLAAKKFVIIGVLAVVTFFKRLFKGGEKQG